MSAPDRIRPTPGYRSRPPEVIRPRADYRPPSLHTSFLPTGSLVTRHDAEWCPICLGRKISERLVSDRPVWHCEDCGHEW